MNILNKTARAATPARAKKERNTEPSAALPGKRPAKKSGRRGEKSILNNVVSLRVSDREKQVLERITASTSQSVSDVVREAIDYWLSRRRRLCRQA